jgi:hypothetical protein
MALPVIRFNAYTGADANLASGAGPESVLAGTQARVFSSTWVGLFEVPNLEEVVVDGSHLLKIASSSGRQWFPITGKKESHIDTTGSINSGSTTLTSIPDTSGMAANDSIKVVGAGAAGADLYAYIYSVDSGVQVTVSVAAGTTVTNAAVVCPPWVKVGAMVTATGAVAWAIGGKRKSLNQCAQLLTSDMTAGWTIEMEILSQYDCLNESVSPITLSTSGTTSGWLTLRGVSFGSLSGVLTRARMKATYGGVNFFNVTGTYWRFEHLQFIDNSAGIELSTSSVKNIVVEDCGAAYSSPAAISECVRVASTATSGRVALFGCSVSGGKLAKVEGTLDRLIVDTCYHSSKTSAYNGIQIDTATPFSVRRTIFDRCASGVYVANVAGVKAGSEVLDCTFYHPTADCVYLPHIDRCLGFVATGNLFATQGDFYGINANASAKYVVAKVDHNRMLEGGQLYVGLDTGAHDAVTYDLAVACLLDPENGDFSPLPKLRGINYPSAFPDLVALTDSFRDIGASQHKDQLGGTTSAALGGTIRVRLGPVSWLYDPERLVVAYNVYDSEGNVTGSGSVVIDSTTFAPATWIRPEFIAEAVRAFMRNGDEADIDGREMLV